VTIDLSIDIDQPVLTTSLTSLKDDNDPPNSHYELQGLSEVNKKLNEFLYRRVSVTDVTNSHIFAMQRLLFTTPLYDTIYTSSNLSTPSNRLSELPPLSFDTFIISASSPFSQSDCETLGKENGNEQFEFLKYQLTTTLYRTERVVGQTLSCMERRI